MYALCIKFILKTQWEKKKTEMKGEIAMRRYTERKF